MAVTIQYDSELEQLRGETLLGGGVFAQLADDDTSTTKIEVWWPSGLPNRQREEMQEALKGLGGKGIEASGGDLPLTLTNCRGLRDTFGERLELSDGLNEWAFNEIERLGNIENFSSASSDAELPEVVRLEAPAIARVVHAYQRAGIAFCAHTKRALLADQPGLGKTLQTIGAIVANDTRGDILVAAPAVAVATTWPDELARWVPGDEVVPIMGTGKRRHERLTQVLADEPLGKRRWIIVNLEMLRADWVKPSREHRINQRTKKMDWMPVPGWWNFRYPELFQGFVEVPAGHDLDTGELAMDKLAVPPWSAIVIDESHRCLITSSAHAQSQTQVRAGAGMLPFNPDGIKLALSGTPMRGKPENLWGTLNWLYPERYSSYWNWAQRWFYVIGQPGPNASDAERRKSSMSVEGLDESRAAEFYQDIKPIMLRRTKREVRAELPDKLYAGTPLPGIDGEVDENSPIGHWVEMTPKQAKAYADMQEQAETLLESGVLVANGVLAELTRLKQFAITYGDLVQHGMKNGEPNYRFEPQLPSTKFDWLLEFLDDLGINKDTSMEPDEEGEERKVVVASQFTSVLDLYAAELNRKGIETLMITGKVNQAQRKEAKDRWQEAGGPRVFLLNTEAGGVSLTLDAADDLVFLDETWIPDAQEQVEDRIHRVSRLHQVTIHYLRTLGTIEENIALVNTNREYTTKLLIDGQRGVNFAKKLLTPIKRS